MGRPSAAACVVRASSRRHPSLLPCFCISENDSGRPDFSTRRRIMPNSASSMSGSSKSMMISSTPPPASASPMAMPVSSSSAARSDGIGSPVTER
ncbi:Uncharacterised protein [Bordetella pertussis]|nr:Uncharacterised protein [Bordetella pertussis]CFN99233.1 Uncharacterised protein [Bordetella pertussis]CFO29115.1 Uncharacterised protein [Bordetella pertussis]CFP01162.1 Uncharacterised protein [Bordetella pertussis]CFT99762.1 Uncharacterised protein [Bordetella pertussis]